MHIYHARALIGLDRWEEAELILRQARIDNASHQNAEEWHDYVQSELRRGDQQGS